MEKVGDTGCSEDVSNEMGNSSFFCKEDSKPLSQTSTDTPIGATQNFSQTELNRILVFRHIEKTQPTTRYRIAKETRLDKTTVRLIVRDLVFAGVVHEKMNVIDDRECKILTIPAEGLE